MGMRANAPSALWRGRKGGVGRLTEGIDAVRDAVKGSQVYRRGRHGYGVCLVVSGETRRRIDRCRGVR